MAPTFINQPFTPPAWDNPDQSHDPLNSLIRGDATKLGFRATFPADLDTEFNGNCIKFTILEHTFSKVSKAKNTNVPAPNSITGQAPIDNDILQDLKINTPKPIDGGCVFLPPTQAILSGLSAQYEELEIGKIGVDALHAGRGSIADLINSVRGIVTENIQAFKSTGTAALASAIISKNDVKDIVGLKIGKVRNPHLQALFKTTPFRGFDFNYIMRPNNRDEAMAIAAIIKFFRYHMSPGLDNGESGFFFQVPYQFKIEFMNNRSHNQYLPKIGRCVLESVAANYTPDSVFAAYADGIPVAVQLDLRFKEIEVITRDKVQNGY